MELKPCPFCGGGAICIPLSGSSGHIACIGECGIKTGVYWDEPMTEPKESRRSWKDILAEKWNRRADNG